MRLESTLIQTAEQSLTKTLANSYHPIVFTQFLDKVTPPK